MSGRGHKISIENHIQQECYEMSELDVRIVKLEPVQVASTIGFGAFSRRAGLAENPRLGG
jgi:hypothetical protein